VVLNDVFIPNDNEKQARVAQEIERLRALFKDLPEDRKILAEKAINRAAWLTISLEDLEFCIDGDGYVTEYQNGENQWGTKKNPDVETHLSMSQRFTQIMDYLNKMLPDKQPVVNDKGSVKEFIRGRPKLPVK